MDRETARGRLESTYGVVRSFAAVVGPPDVEPDDLVQEAFVRALQRGLDDIADLPAYLRRIVLNLSSSSRRRWSIGQAALSRLGPLTESSEDDLQVLSEIYRLPPDVRAAVWMAEIEGYSYAEIGHLLGCSEDAARTRASRGRRRLRLELTQEIES